MSEKGLAEYSYRENANPAAFEMDNLRQRLYAVETRTGNLLAWRRVAIALLTLLVASTTTLVAATALMREARVTRSIEACRDSSHQFINSPESYGVFTCENPRSRMVHRSDYTIDCSCDR